MKLGVVVPLEWIFSPSHGYSLSIKSMIHNYTPELRGMTLNSLVWTVSVCVALKGMDFEQFHLKRGVDFFGLK